MGANTVLNSKDVGSPYACSCATRVNRSARIVQQKLLAVLGHALTQPATLSFEGSIANGGFW